jgi:oligopeptide transport system substrate-binding protein
VIWRVVGLLVGVSLVVTGCESSQPPVRFATQQVLRLVASQDVLTLDPSKIHQASVELSLARNVFGGLYRFRDDLVEEPDLAKAMPEISADGLRWTFRLKPDARFSNGNPVKARDVLYSWNRVAALNPDTYGSSSIFEVVAGYADVVSGKTKTLSGLTAPDDYTVEAQLTQPAGWWLVELGLWATALVDQTVVQARGEDSWWSTPEYLIGTGPFRMSKRDPGQSLDFEPVPNWWGGPTGRLKQVHVDVVADLAAQASRYSAGDADILGYAPNDVVGQFNDETIKRFTTDRMGLSARPWLMTFFLGFRREGRLGTDADADARRAISLALDRQKLAEVCHVGATCAPATGGLIVDGLAGYLGAGADPYAKSDVPRAVALLRSWDPTGGKLRVLRIGAGPDFGPLAKEVQAELKAALGLDVQLQVAEFASIRQHATAGDYDAVVGANYADYDSPHNWFSQVTSQCQAAFLNPRLGSLVAAADTKPPTNAVSDYEEAGKLLVNSAACPALAYLQGVYLIKPWVDGAGGNAMYEYYWKGISILEH